MALNNSKCNHLMLLHFKGLTLWTLISSYCGTQSPDLPGFLSSVRFVLVCLVPFGSDLYQ